MKIERNANEDETVELLVDDIERALESVEEVDDLEGYEVGARTEEGNVTLRTSDGRKFEIRIWEIGL